MDGLLLRLLDSQDIRVSIKLHLGEGSNEFLSYLRWRESFTFWLLLVCFQIDSAVNLRLLIS